MSNQDRRIVVSRKQGGIKLFTGKESFPSVLYSMLDELEDQGHSDIVSWQPHGRCFLVHKRHDFIEDVLPAFFRMSKFTSFQRQLNLYGFQRVASGKDKGGYFHELFLRGRKELCETIPRQQVKGVGKRMSVNPATQPNFYLMDFLSADSNNTLSDANQASFSATMTMPFVGNSQSIVESSLLASMYPSMLTEPTASSSVNPYTPSAIQQQHHQQQQPLTQTMMAACSEVTGYGNFGSFVSVMSHGVAHSPGTLAAATAGTSGITSAPSHGLIAAPAVAAPQLPSRIPCLPTWGGDPSPFATMNPNSIAHTPFTLAPAPHAPAGPAATANFAPAPSASGSRTDLLRTASSLAASPICNSPEPRRDEAGNPLLDAHATAMQSTYVEALHSAYMDALHSGAADSHVRDTTYDVRRSSASEQSLRDWIAQNLSYDDLSMDD